MITVLAKLRGLPSYQYLAEALGADPRRTAIELIVTNLCLEAVDVAKGDKTVATHTLQIVGHQNEQSR